MGKPDRTKKGRPPAKPGAPPARPFSPEAQELRVLLRRVPDGFQATLNALAAKPADERDRVLAELARGLGKEILPLVRAAALGTSEDLACSAVRTLPLFGTRAAGDVLVEVYEAAPEGERAQLARNGAQALQARGIHIEIPGDEPASETLRYTLRETSVSAPDGVGSRSVAARLQDQYGVWHAILVLWNDQAGVKDGFMRPMSRHEWEERMEKMAERGMTHAPCPPDFARWQVAQARRLNETTGFPLEDHLKEWDEHVGPPPDGYEPPDPTVGVRGASPEQQAEWATASANLFRQADVQRWFLEAGDCVEWTRRWVDLQNRIRLRGKDEGIIEELTEFLGKAVGELLDLERLRLYRERLADLARVYRWRHQEQPARQAATAALWIDEPRDAGNHPFLVALVERSLRATAAMLARGEDVERTRYRPLRRYQS